MASQACDNGVVNHVAGSTTVHGYTYRVMGMKGINVGRLAGLYTEGCRLRATIKVTNLVVELAIVDTRRYFATFLKVIVKDVGDLSCFSDIFTIFFWEMAAFA